MNIRDWIGKRVYAVDAGGKVVGTGVVPEPTPAPPVFEFRPPVRQEPWGSQHLPPNEVQVNIQWKNTDLCADWQCVCSPADELFEWHTDGYTYGRLECDRCGRVFQLMHAAVAVEVARD